MKQNNPLVLASVLIAAATFQLPTAFAAQPSKTQASLMAGASAAYSEAFQSLSSSPYVQVEENQKSTIQYGLTKLGKKTPSIANQLRTEHDLEKDAAQIDASSAKQVMILYHSSDTMQGSVTALQIGSKFYSNTPKGWVANNVDVGSVAGMLTLRAIAPFNTFIHPVVKATSQGYVISGDLNIQKYFAEVKAQMTAMNLVLPGLNNAAQTSFMKHMYEHDTVTLQKVGHTYVMTEDVSTDRITIPPTVMAQMLGASPSALSRYLSSMTEQTSSTTTYTYKKKPIQIPAGVKKLQGNGQGTTVGGSVYGTN